MEIEKTLKSPIPITNAQNPKRRIFLNIYIYGTKIKSQKEKLPHAREVGIFLYKRAGISHSLGAKSWYWMAELRV